MRSKAAISVGFLWLARVCALLLFVFWGAFFVEHLREWFFQQRSNVPPASVWVGQSLHLAMLVGLGLLIFRPAWGAAVTALATFLFFSSIGYKGFPYVALLNLPPIVFALIYATMREPNKRMQATEAPHLRDR